MGRYLEDHEIKRVLVTEFPLDQGGYVLERDRVISRAAADHAVEFLASSAGVTDPCVGCDIWPTDELRATCMNSPNPCVRRRCHLAALSGLALADERVKQREREIVEWLENEADNWIGDMDACLTVNAILMKFKTWLEGK